MKGEREIKKMGKKYMEKDIAGRHPVQERNASVLHTSTATIFKPYPCLSHTTFPLCKHLKNKQKPLSQISSERNTDKFVFPSTLSLSHTRGAEPRGFVGRSLSAVEDSSGWAEGSATPQQRGSTDDAATRLQRPVTFQKAVGNHPEFLKLLKYAVSCHRENLI